MIKFSKYGWHGVISDEITFENMSIVAQAAADYLNDYKDKASIVIGYDTRFLSREYAWTIQKVFTSNGIKTYLHKKPIPAAFLSLSVKLFEADLGVMVTGEGRPARYSGLIFKLDRGQPAAQTWMSNLFNYLYRRYPRSSEDNRYLLEYIDVYENYKKSLTEYVDLSLIKACKPVVLTDSYFGSVGIYVQELLKEYGIQGAHIRTKPNPGFSDALPQPNDRNMQPLSKLLLQKRGQLGSFYSGDGTQTGIIVADGTILPNAMASAVALYEWLNLCENSNVYTEVLTPELAVPFLAHYNREAVPDYLLEEENSFGDAVIWDRQSLTFNAFIPEKDGIFQSLLILQALCRNNMSWDCLLDKIQVMTGNRIMEQKTVNMDVNVWNKKRKAFFEDDIAFLRNRISGLTENDDTLKIALEDGSWLGFCHNENEGSLSIYYDAPEKAAEKSLYSQAVNWINE